MKIRMMKIGFACMVLSSSLLACSGVFAADAAKESRDEATTEKKLEAARHRLDQAAREVAELSAGMANRRIPDTLMFLGRNPNRAILGMGIGESDDDKDNKQTDGASVLAVSPGGAAESAGLKAGDIITEIDGKSLKRDAETSSREKLLSAISKLSPGDKVALTYKRAGKSNKATLTAQTLPNYTASIRRLQRRLEVPEPPEPPMPPMFGAHDFDVDTMHIIGMHRGDQFGSVELIAMTPKLGQYFGTEKGLLIVHAPNDSQDKNTPRLEEGDVLIDIGGRVPNNPGHAFAILASYQAGEKVTLNVMRQHKKQALHITIPQQREHDRARTRIQRTIRVPMNAEPDLLPVPPLPPIGPTAPVPPLN